MKTFDDLKSHWEAQQLPKTPKNGSKAIIRKIDAIKRNQHVAIFVFISTLLVLTFFFFYIHAYVHLVVTFGLLLMICALLIRLIIEYFSIKKLMKLDVTKDALSFKEDMIVYYNARIKTHYIATPIIILTYIVGFCVLLPSFKQSLSSGFYTYVWVSAIVLFFIMVFFIGREIKTELRDIKKLTSN